MLLIVLTIVSTIGISAQNTMIREHQSARRLVTCSILDGRIEHLCDSLCEGRGSGQRGGGLAAIWLQREFERIGLMRMSGGYAHAVKLGDGKYGRNIIGMLPGSKTTTRDRYVIVGAHYDHLGTLDGKMYPGADANASGTAALLSLAEMLSEYKNGGRTHDSNVIFVAFDAKEHDMAGSKALWRMIENGQLRDPQSGKTINKDQISLMVNIDQVGCTMSPLASGRRDYIIMLGNESLKPIKRDMLRICNRMFAISGIGMEGIGSPLRSSIIFLKISINIFRSSFFLLWLVWPFSQSIRSAFITSLRPPMRSVGKSGSFNRLYAPALEICNASAICLASITSGMVSKGCLFIKMLLSGIKKQPRFLVTACYAITC